MDKTEKKLVDFALGLDPARLPCAAVAAAKLRLIDTLGVALAAHQAPTVGVARQLSNEVSSRPFAREWGTLKRTTVEQATLVNSAMVRYLDMSDAYLRASTAHPSDNIPALVAMAEANGADGQALLGAIVVSYEVHLRMCDRVPFFTAGWDQSLAAVPAAVLGCGMLLELDAARLRHALAIGVTATLATRQTRSGHLSMWKGMAGPYAARQAVFAVQAAAAGMSGPERSFEGDFGLWQVALGKRYALRLRLPSERRTLGVQQSNIKLFPVRDAVQVPVGAALELRKQCDVSRIEHLRIDSYRHAFELQARDRGFWRPRTRESADHSLPACVAMALLDGRLDVDSFDCRRFEDADVRRLCRRTELCFDEEFDNVAPATRNVRLTATLRGGASCTVAARQTAADVVRGPGEEAVVKKFERLTGSVLPKRRRRQLLDAVWRLEKLGNVSELVALCRCS